MPLSEPGDLSLRISFKSHGGSIAYTESRHICSTIKGIGPLLLPQVHWPTTQQNKLRKSLKASTCLDAANHDEREQQQEPRQRAQRVRGDGPDAPIARARVGVYGEDLVHGRPHRPSASQQPALRMPRLLYAMKTFYVVWAAMICIALQ